MTTDPSTQPFNMAKLLREKAYAPKTKEPSVTTNDEGLGDHQIEERAEYITLPVAAVKSEARQYVEAGFVLVPFARGLKGPEGPAAVGWNKREKCVVPPDWTGNIGLAHTYSRT